MEASFQSKAHSRLGQGLAWSRCLASSVLAHTKRLHITTSLSSQGIIGVYTRIRQLTRLSRGISD
jgi:hypothetical protein